MCLSKNLTEAFLKHSLMVRISNLLRLVPQNRDGTSLPTIRLDEWEAILGLECLEALREGTHMGRLTGHSNTLGGSLVVYLLGNNWSGPGADEEEDSTVGGKGGVLTGKLVGEDASQIWLLCAPCRDPSRGPTHLVLEVPLLHSGQFPELVGLEE